VLPRSGSQIDALARSRFVPDFRSVRVSGPLDFSARAQLSVAGLPRAFSRGRSSPIFVFLFVSPARVRSFFGHRSLFASLALDALLPEFARRLVSSVRTPVRSRQPPLFIGFPHLRAEHAVLCRPCLEPGPVF
jgi:hypothetical protein